MPCFAPLPAQYADKMTKNGKFKVIVYPRTEENLGLDSYTGELKYPLRMPCGRCSHCRLKRSREWAIRCMHEASLYVPSVNNPSGRGNCFITLTYNNAHLPEHDSLCKRDFQLFMKRLRKRFGSGIRYYMCGEYGGKYGRPHYHVLLFNWNFDFDKYFWQRSTSGFDLYRSPSLEELWSDDNGSIGFSSVADLTFDSAAYVARYVMKKVTGDAALDHYCVIDYDTGELLARKLPEYNDMSRRPGIAHAWFEKFSSDVYSSDMVVIGNKKFTPPKYYDRQLELISPEDIARVKDKRRDNVQKISEERLAVMRRCKERQVEKLVRTLDYDGVLNDS